MNVLMLNETEYDMSENCTQTLMAHGVIRKCTDDDEDYNYRLATVEELQADPASAGVNNNHPAAVIAVMEALLTLGEA